MPWLCPYMKHGSETFRHQAAGACAAVQSSVFCGGGICGGRCAGVGPDGHDARGAGGRDLRPPRTSDEELSPCSPEAAQRSRNGPGGGPSGSSRNLANRGGHSARAHHQRRGRVPKLPNADHVRHLPSGAAAARRRQNGRLHPDPPPHARRCSHARGPHLSGSAFEARVLQVVRLPGVRQTKRGEAVPGCRAGGPLAHQGTVALDGRGRLHLDQTAGPPRAEDPAALPQAFPFGYIAPRYPTIETVMRRDYAEELGPLDDIPGTGPAPALMRVAEWMRVVPRWEEITAAMEKDEQAKKKLAWVREMYAFSLACAREKIKLQLQLPPLNKLMVQPPADHGVGAAALMHYTWGSVISDSSGKEVTSRMCTRISPSLESYGIVAADTQVWRFDKRDFSDPQHELDPPQLPEPPPFEAGMKLQDGVAVTRELRDTLALLIRTMNEGIAALKPLITPR